MFHFSRIKVEFPRSAPLCNRLLLFSFGSAAQTEGLVSVCTCYSGSYSSGFVLGMTIGLPVKFTLKV
jgi:hypothetical protein